MMMVDYIDRGVRTSPDSPCMVLPDGTVHSTHREFNALTHRIAAALITEGLQVGEPVAVYSPNDPNAFAAVVAVIRAGGVWTAINAASGVPELANFLALTGCARLIYHGSLADRAAHLIDASPDMTTVISIGAGLAGDPTLESWMAAEGELAPPQPYDVDRPVLLLPTGGTTGAPKAVPVTNRMFHLMSLALNAQLAEPEPPRFICATPMTHAAGVVALPVLSEGGAVVVHQGVDSATILDSIARNRASRIFLPPTALYTLLGHQGVRDHDFSSLRHFLIAGAPIAPDRLAEAVDVFGPVLVQVFGQAESPMMCTVFTTEQIAEAAANPEHRGRLASCGQPSLVARVEIMDGDGNLLGPGEQGEIVVRSDLVFTGYWNNPAATAEAQRPGGWHGTGDVGLRDEHGFVYILDRKRDLIITGGFNVYPSEVEAVLHSFHQVQDCAVIGVPDTKWGEAVTAVVEPRAGEQIDGDALIAACKQRLGSVKAPKAIIVRTLPRSPVGKVLKRELREEYWTSSLRRV